MTKTLTPDLIVSGVTEITAGVLESMGVDGLLIDVDDTISEYGSRMVSEETRNWLDSIKEFNVRVILVSNSSRERSESLASELNLSYVHRAMKPLPFGINEAIKVLGSERDKTAMVGDQLFADVLGAKLCGIKSILVRPLSEAKTLSLRLKRLIERKMIKVPGI